MTVDKKVLIIHYDEIALKGKNQPFFVDKLLQNIKNKLKTATIRTGSSKIIVENYQEEDIELLKLTPGIATMAEAFQVKTDLDKINEAALKIAKLSDAKTFKVETTRAFKQFKLNSMEISCDVGSFVLSQYSDSCSKLLSSRPCRRDLKSLDKRSLTVDVHNPELVIKIELEKDKTCVQGQKIQGVGGLPVGTAGKVVCLLSGGIDSPVAAFEMMKRGAKVEFIHFHNKTINKSGVEVKIRKLVERLETVQGKSKLHIVPFEDYQKDVIANVPADLRMIVYRRIMFRIADKMMDKSGAKAIVTGDSLSQVASQTLENMTVIYQATDKLKLAPLIGKNKREIIDIAQKIGTYDISIEPYEDCCSFMIAKHPQTKSKLEDVLEVETELTVI